MRNKIFSLLISILAVNFWSCNTQQTSTEENAIELRVEKMLSDMTLEEKINYISGMRLGGHGPNQWDGTKGIERLNLAPFKIYHGPYGVSALRYAKKNGTYYPSSINMATTWNPELVQEATTSLSKELKASGGQSNAGPGMNIIRDLRGGRSSEYFTEAPYLNGEIASAYLKGIQSQGNFAIMKHYICNNQERERNYIDVKVSERALREIYLPGFKQAVVKGGVLGVMTGYNTINGKHSSENKHLIQDILKDEWGFKGIVMTDWSGSAESAVSMIKAGTDLEMPRPKTLTPSNVLKAIEQGEIDENAIDEMVKRILYVTYFTGVMDKNPEIKPEEIATLESIEIAGKVADESFVLLKNENAILPINREQVKRIAVIGPNGDFGAHFRDGAKTYQMLQGGGSASISPPANKMITPLKGIQNYAKGVKVSYEPGSYGEHGCTTILSEFLETAIGDKGLNARYFATNNLEGEYIEKIDEKINFRWQKTPGIIEQGNSKQNGSDSPFSVEWTGKLKTPVTRNYTFEVMAQGAVKVFINNQLVVDKDKPGVGWDKFAMGSIHLEKGMNDIRVEFRKTCARNQCQLLWDYGNDAYLEKALALAKTSDIVVMPVGTSGRIETEALDRDEQLNRSESLALSKAQENLIKEVAKVNKNVVVVTFTAGVVCENWKDDVSAIIYGGFPGQEGGNALGRILFGEVNPSGKLTVSIPKTVSQYPEKWYSYEQQISYDEGIFVGYRYFDENNLEPAFPFGHGLSYTSFNYGNMKTPKKVKIGNAVDIQVSITNTGKTAGKETVQVYVKDLKSSELRPNKELKAFKKVALSPNETQDISFSLKPEAFAFFSEAKNQWVTEPGAFEIWIGSSSSDIKQKAKIILE
ncbi:MAG: beta-glucosidase H [Jejuia sp.]